MEQDSKKSQLSANAMIPLAIIVAGVLIAGAVLYTAGNKGSNSPREARVGSKALDIAENAAKNVSVKQVSAQDHVRGNVNAQVFIVEFSDTECPFCKRFHTTMQGIMEEYKKEGKVAWVYRHFPLDSIHPKSRKEAEATECANELGGNEKFWAYVDRIFEVTPSNNGLDPAELPKIAKFVGLDTSQFTQCLSSGKFASRVQENLDDALNAGGQGTPYSIVIGQNGKKFIISGAQPNAAVKSIIDLALSDQPLRP